MNLRLPRWTCGTIELEPPGIPPPPPPPKRRVPPPFLLSGLLNAPTAHEPAPGGCAPRGCSFDGWGAAAIPLVGTHAVGRAPVIERDLAPQMSQNMLVIHTAD